ncbi:MAG: hypothetical protein QNJ29_09035 [Rhizobiaceae bacterium]|nr:hypothetical protein [Rhizobiaceae bacterium]
MFIDEEIEFIKSQIAHHERSVEFFHSKRDHSKANRHSGILRRFQDVLPKMVEIQKHGLQVNHEIDTASDKIGSRLGNLSDLPEELKKQLVSIQYDETEQAILDVIKDNFDGIASIDEIMVGLFRSSGEMHQRDVLANKIYRMTRKDLLFSVSGRKGVYSVSRQRSVNKVDDSDHQTTEPLQTSSD